ECSSLELGAINGPTQCVLTGVLEEVEQIERRLEQLEVRNKRLRTSHGFHSRLMEEAAREYVEEVRKVKLKGPQISYISNVTGTWVKAEEAVNAEYWGRQMRDTVRYWEGLERIRSDVAQRVMLEVGPGEVLSRIAKQTRRGTGEDVISTLGEVEGADLEAVLEATGRLWANGVVVDWEQVRGAVKCRRQRLPGYAFERERYWIEGQRGGREEETRIRPQKDVGEWFYVPVWHESVIVGKAEEVKKRQPHVWMVIGEEGGPGEEIAERLKEEGEEVVL